MSELRAARGVRLHHDAIQCARRAALRLCVHMYLDWLLLTLPQTAVVVQSGKMHAMRSAVSRVSLASVAVNFDEYAFARARL